MKVLFTLGSLFISVIVFSQSSDLVRISVDKMNDHQVWCLKYGQKIERLDSVEVRQINPNWIKAIEVINNTSQSSLPNDTTYIYIVLKRKKTAKYLTLIGHD